MSAIGGNSIDRGYYMLSSTLMEDMVNSGVSSGHMACVRRARSTERSRHAKIIF